MLYRNEIMKYLSIRYLSIVVRDNTRLDTARSVRIVSRNNRVAYRGKPPRPEPLPVDCFAFFANIQISQLDRCKIDQRKMPRISKRASLLKEYEAVAKIHAVKA